jgi:diguanylate cyclase (GGDEF)-like protein/PAS domain S-box-containing protein
MPTDRLAGAHVMAAKIPETQNPDRTPILDLKALAAIEQEQEPVIELVDIASENHDHEPFVDMEDNASATHPQSRSVALMKVLRTNAPELQFLIRCILPLFAAIYFSIYVQDPLLIPLPAIFALLAVFLLLHIYLHFMARRHGFRRRFIVAANQVDIAAAHLAWLCDPMEPTAMVLMVLIAVLGNGIQHGISTFRYLLFLTAFFAPIVITVRYLAVGITLTSYLYFFLGAFLLLYVYVLMRRIDARQSQTDKRNTDLELDNFKLKQVGIALQKSEARYRNIFENSSAAMVLIEENMQISLINSKFEELTGYTKSDVYNKKRLTDFIFKDDLERIKRYHLKRKIKGGMTPTEYECKLVDNQQKIKHVIIRFNVVPWHERIMATIVDITSRKQARDALERSNQKLRQAASLLTASERRYRGLFENTGTATILVEKNMKISMVNSQFLELIGYGRDEIVGKKRLNEFIERSNLFRIKRFHAKQKAKGLPLPNEYECLMVDKKKNLKHVVMKSYTPPGQSSSIVSFFDITSRKEAEKALQEAHEKLRLISVIDELTQVANRRQFNERLYREWNRLRRDGLPLAMIMCDVDCFKPYNDNYGHQNGDRCLRAIADAIRKTVKRSVDLVARYGGEEFAVIMPNTDAQGAFCVAEAIRLAIEQLEIPNRESTVGPVITLSLGVSSMIPTTTQHPDTLIKNADKALYEAKRQGRNRTIMGKTERTGKIKQIIRWDSTKPLAR